MADDLPTPGKGVYLFFEFIALGFALEGVASFVRDGPWFIWVGSLTLAALFLWAGIKGPAIKERLFGHSVEGKVPRSTQVVTLLLLMTWAFLVYNYAEIYRLQDIPEFDVPKASIQIDYGVNGFDCFITANGDRFLRYRDKFRIAASCLITNGATDILDAPRLQVGSPHDITQGPIHMTVERAGANIPLGAGANYLILLVPMDVQITQFTTLRQARLLGVKIKLAGATSIPK